MSEELREKANELLKELMVLGGDIADLNKRFYLLWNKLDEILNGEKE